MNIYEQCKETSIPFQEWQHLTGFLHKSMKYSKQYLEALINRRKELDNILDLGSELLMFTHIDKSVLEKERDKIREQIFHTTGNLSRLKETTRKLDLFLATIGDYQIPEDDEDIKIENS